MVRNYIIVTASYWGFTLVDGALRMLVLFHFFRLGYTPFTLAFLFLLYETAGIAANLAGGYFASRFGIPRMLAIGQMLQIAGLLMLSALDPGWGAAASVAWVVIAQGIAGVAKDLTKTASKSAIKATSVEGSGQLFRWVAWFTGSKNAMKGIGFFVGGLLLDLVGFTHALWMMAALLGVIFIAGLVLLPSQLGKAKSSKTIRELFGKSRGVNLLAAARIFMFGARDVWFVVGLPVFLYAHGWKFLQVGGFLAAWTVAYGGIQAIAPTLVRTKCGWPQPRGAISQAVGGGSCGRTDCTSGYHELNRRCASRSRLGGGIGTFRSAVRSEFVPALVSYPGLRGIRKGSGRRRILLCSQCSRPAPRHHVVRSAVSGRGHYGLPDRLGRHAPALLPHHIHHSAQCRRLKSGTGADLSAGKEARCLLAKLTVHRPLSFRRLFQPTDEREVMPAGLEVGIQSVSWAGAALWTAYKFARWECISTGNIFDQIGMAFWILSLTMFFSRLGAVFVP